MLPEFEWTPGGPTAIVQVLKGIPTTLEDVAALVVWGLSFSYLVRLERRVKELEKR